MEACTAQPLLTAGLAASSRGPETPKVLSNPWYSAISSFTAESLNDVSFRRI